MDFNLSILDCKVGWVENNCLSPLDPIPQNIFNVANSSWETLTPDQIKLNFSRAAIMGCLPSNFAEPSSALYSLCCENWFTTNDQRVQNISWPAIAIQGL